MMRPIQVHQKNLAYGGHVADFRHSCSPLTEGFVTENRAQNKLEYHQEWYLYSLEN